MTAMMILKNKAQSNIVSFTSFESLIHCADNDQRQKILPVPWTAISRRSAGLPETADGVQA